MNSTSFVSKLPLTFHHYSKKKGILTGGPRTTCNCYVTVKMIKRKKGTKIYFCGFFGGCFWPLYTNKF